jgi:VanZ family protein
MKPDNSLITNHVETRPSLWIRWGYALTLAMVIVVASGRSSVAAPDIVDIDKVAHFAVFGLLATLVARAGFAESRMGWAVLIVSLFGLTDEWHQSFTPGRTVEVYDWFADTLGAITAVALYRYLGWYRGILEKPLFRRKARVEK